MNILGIETSCDETAVSIVTDRKEILSNVVWSQLAKHREFGGVVPEVSARAHLSRIESLVEEALARAKISLEDLDGIAATCGPGLIGGVMIGAMMGKALASVLQKPFLAINHLMAHALTPRLFSEIPFPYLLLLVSGGHCQLLVARSPLDYDLLGSTLDDAVGEAFDKVGRMLGIDYPAGSTIERLAQKGNPRAYNFPKPLLNRKDSCDFSFSGLKTAARQLIEQFANSLDEKKNDICASFQYTVGEILKNRSQNALRQCLGAEIHLNAFVMAGGVASNVYLYSQLESVSRDYVTSFKAPPPEYCVDNGAMVAWAGVELMGLGVSSSLDFSPRPRWPLTELKGTYQ